MQKNNMDKIVRRYYFCGELYSISPLNLGSGETLYTKSDLTRDWEGNVFLPGTSITGALRSFLFNYLRLDENSEVEDIVREVFGFEETEEIEETFQSLITVYDSYIIETSDISIRDGVGLNYFTKTTLEKKKFDFEILEPGVKFDFKLELIIRKKHEENNCIPKIEELIYILLNSLENGKITFGAKTSRGFGQVILKNLKILKLLMNEDANKWLEFNWNDFPEKVSNNLIDLSTLNHKLFVGEINELYNIRVRFKFPYSLLIRSYNPLPGEVDVIQLASNGNHIIPGTSWTGAIRSAIYNMGLELAKEFNSYSNEPIEFQKEIISKFINDLFGYVEENKKKETKEIEARSSRIIINESRLEKNKNLSYTRTKVDRITGGVVKGALFSEGYSNQGEIDLELNIRNPKSYEIGLILLAICELWNGIQPIGGTTSIGRGILKGQKLYLDEDDEPFTDLNAPKIQNYIQEFGKELKNRVNKKVNRR